jgi:hypothetical protein
VGTWTTTQTIPSLGAGSFNVYGPRIYQIMDSKVVHFPVPALTNFTGSVEFSGSSPFYVFSGKPFETGQATDSDPDRAWYKAWDAWSNEIPAIWDDGLQAFVIPYTNYWHNVKEWAVGWHSTLRIENNSEQTVTYSVKHNPDTYGEISNPALACQATHYQAQTVAITLDQGKELSTPLEILYGWPADHASFMEGILLIQPDPVTAWKETLVASTVVPNGSGSGMCSSGAPLAAVLITSPIPTVSGTVSFSAATFLGRGYMTDKVEYYIDGKLKSTTRTGPDSFEWNTVSTPNGLHTLMVIAFGTEGGTASQSVTVRVSNPPAR